MPGSPGNTGGIETAVFKKYVPDAQQAGFTGNALITIMAIAFAESGLNPAAQNTNSDGSIDRGILQINSRWHPEVTDTCAYDPVCAFKAGWTISQQGRNFNPWVSYHNRTSEFQTGMTAATAVIGNQPIPNADNVAGSPANGQPGDIPAQIAALNPLNGIMQSLPMFGIKVALFMGALMLLIIGLWVLTRDPAADAGGAVSTGLNNVAVGVGKKIGSVGKGKKKS